MNKSKLVLHIAKGIVLLPILILSTCFMAIIGSCISAFDPKFDLMEFIKK
jgi:hypothetical protein